jgi:hypothetical protein
VVLNWTSSCLIPGGGGRTGVGSMQKEQSGYQDVQCSTSVHMNWEFSIKKLALHLTMHGGYANHVGQFCVLGKFLVWFQGTRWCMVSSFVWNLNQRERP